MDSETIKIVFPVLGGAMVLAGGALTFINGRLNEAQTPAARHRIIFWVKQSIVIVVALVGAASLAVGLFSVGGVCYLVNFCIFVTDFIMRDKIKITRVEIATYAICCSFFGAGFSILWSTYFMLKIMNSFSAQLLGVIHALGKTH